MGDGVAMLPLRYACCAYPACPVSGVGGACSRGDAASEKPGCMGMGEEMGERGGGRRGEADRSLIEASVGAEGRREEGGQRRAEEGGRRRAEEGRG
jgi:hypothetical protein